MDKPAIIEAIERNYEIKFKPVRLNSPIEEVALMQQLKTFMR